ncbi:MAG: hypothetical protein JNJ54_32720 [Myxococcaceae bacterium]|nr:hypothetical protein [Myxococcaceae bacterium]
MTGWVLWTVMAMASGQRIELAVDYVAPDVCPPQARFEAELAARSDRLRVTTGSAQATVTLRITEQKKRFSGTSRVRTTMSGVTTREFKSTRCETLVQAAALATSLLLDPEGTRTGEVTVSALFTVADAGVPELLDAGAAAPEADAGRPALPESLPADAGVATAPSMSAAVGADGGVPGPAPVSLELGVGGGVHSGISGALDGVMQATVALQWRHFRVAVSPLLLPGRRVTSVNGVMRYLGVGGRLDTLVSLRVAFLRLEAGVQLTVLGVPLSAPEAEVPGRAVAWVVAPGPLGRVVFVAGALRVAVEGGAGVSLLASRKDIEGAGAVFTMPRVFAVLGGLVGWAF